MNLPHPTPPAVNLITEIGKLAKEGLGYEDIALRLGLTKQEVRPFVIGRRG